MRGPGFVMGSSVSFGDRVSREISGEFNFRDFPSGTRYYPDTGDGGFPIRYVSYCILMYSAVYLDVSRSYTSLDVSRSNATEHVRYV